MRESDNPLGLSGQFSTDVLVVGAGVMGLWCAVKAAEAGHGVTLVDRARPGAGASGGLLGALFPWMPNKWDEKKQFQFEALTRLEAELAPLEAETGLSAGYARVGRIIPLPKPHLRVIAERHEKDAHINWRQKQGDFFWRVSGEPPAPSYIAPPIASAGYVHDTLAARANPRQLVALLKAWLLRQPNVQMIESAELLTVDATAGIASFRPSPNIAASAATPPVSPQVGGRSRQGDEGQSLKPEAPTIRTDTAPSSRRPARLESALDIAYGRLVLAEGADGFQRLQTLLPPLAKPIGHAVKGQAALMAARLDPSLPVAFLDGVYIVPHENGHVAIGSTSEDTFDHPTSTDGLLDSVIEKARGLVPALAKAPVIERWAGVRPKAIARDPMVGPLPDHPAILALTGGFKISFGLAHALADACVDFIEGREPETLPQGFRVAAHIREAG